MNYLNLNYNKLENYALENKENYVSAKPFPHIVIDNFFNNDLLNNVINEFPKNLDKIGNKFENKVERKLSLNKSHLLSNNTNNFLNFLNSQIFLNFLQNLTDIDEKLVPDPYLLGGGLHELRKDGYLNIHADFNLHPSMKLDRRLNILIYLNKDWKESFGGSLQLWDKNMKECIQKIIPEFNRMVIFSTTDFSYHGNPDKVSCTEDNSRKSIAMYYYSNGRPSNERKLGLHSTIFRKRPDTNEPDGNVEFKKIFGQFYIRRKKKID